MVEWPTHYDFEESQVVAPIGGVLVHLLEEAIVDTFNILVYNYTIYKSKEDCVRLRGMVKDIQDRILISMEVISGKEGKDYKDKIMWEFKEKNEKYLLQGYKFHLEDATSFVTLYYRCHLWFWM